MTNNKQEKIAHLFSNNEGPDIQRVDISSTFASVRLHVPNNLSWFDGHFPEQKILPGVVQVDWAGKLAKALFADIGEFKQLSNIKFKSVVVPNTNMELELSYDMKKGSIKFHFFSQSESFSMGTIKFLTL
ncbi:ApeI family dehydratase [Eionea flava]